MQFRGYPITHLPARAVLLAFDRVKQLEMKLKLRFPSLLGLPVMGPYVQFYRQDALFRTELSVFNFYSTFLPTIATQLTYYVTAYRRDGACIGSGQLVLEHGHSTTVALEAIIGKPLDDYGVFHVQATARSNDTTRATALGPTTGQFMTLYCPTDATRQAPQCIHSHKLFQALPIPYSPYTRTTGFTADLAGNPRNEFFFLNPCLSATRITLHAFDTLTGTKIAAFTRTIKGCGVERFTLTPADLGASSNPLTFTYEFDRRVSHMKPIVFHHHADGVVTCNHT